MSEELVSKLNFYLVDLVWSIWHTDVKRVIQGREESVKEFVTRNLGQEVFERLIEPFCSGKLFFLIWIFNELQWRSLTLSALKFEFKQYLWACTTSGKNLFVLYAKQPMKEQGD